MMNGATGMGIGVALAGMLFQVISLPLIWGKVPMNRYYGIRIAASFESNERWYAINAHGGRLMARWGWVTVAWGAAGWLVPASYRLMYVGLSPLALLIPLGSAVLWTLVWAHKAHPSHEKVQ
jgi:hypothetical protein